MLLKTYGEMVQIIKPELCKDRKTFAKLDLAEYIAEKKFDGERIIAIKEGDDIILQRRSGKDATHVYPEVVEALRAFKNDIILDGEMVVFIDGVDDFQEGLQPRIHLKNENKIYTKSLETPATYMLFDILHAGNADLRQRSLDTRKAYLNNYYKQFIQGTTAKYNIKVVEYSEFVEDVFDIAKKNGWEGVVLKPKLAMYMESSRKQWIKRKITFDADFIFTAYEENNKGIKLLKYEHDERDQVVLNISEENPLVIQCGGEQSSEVKYLLDKNDEAYVTVSYMNKTSANRLRMPVFKKVVD
ncbi:hypothetical protein LCGC14_1004380 [marine sediment metagenome]|uniref:ATP-dependent DNA ligase family profile domain-containing protein n=1 Tax=marine sediment metagenome TaxID=412755 RepID=A0A0F9N264_9ZZZZ